MSKVEKPVVGISIGDVNGIGMEVVIKTFLDNRMLDFCTPVVYASQKVAQAHRKALGIDNFSFNVVGEGDKLNPKRANLINVWEEEVQVELGEVTPSGGKYAFRSLDAAVQDLAANKVDVLVTAPINKHNMPEGQFNAAGHTEFLANYANVDNYLMIMVAGDLRVGLVTGHVPLRDVAAALTVDAILTKLDVFAKSLTQDFGVRAPKIAILGLNPHAGDNGKIGMEEKEIIIPAMQKARDRGIMTFGPFGADGLFGSGAWTKYDGVLAMYHDQGLGPFKTMAFEDGVNFTAGLPIVRTSPDHGTGYDLAGKGLASEASFRNAVYAACDIWRSRKAHKEITANPLPISPPPARNQRERS